MSSAVPTRDLRPYEDILTVGEFCERAAGGQIIFTSGRRSPPEVSRTVTFGTNDPGRPWSPDPTITTNRSHMEDPMLISQTLRRSAVAIAPDDTVTKAAGVMDSAGVGALAVIDDGRPIGIVTDRDLVRRAMAHRLSPDARVDTVMSTPLVTIAADADQHDAFAAFRGNAVRRLVVVDADGGFAGMVSVDDLLIDLAADLHDLAQPVTAEVLFGHHDSPVPAVPSGSEP